MSTARVIQSTSHPWIPNGGASRSTHINVPKGRKITPSKGKMNVSNTASTYAGRAIQMITNRSRGESAPMIASKQPIQDSPLSMTRGAYPGRGLSPRSRFASPGYPSSTGAPTSEPYSVHEPS